MWHPSFISPRTFIPKDLFLRVDRKTFTIDSPHGSVSETVPEPRPRSSRDVQGRPTPSFPTGGGSTSSFLRPRRKTRPGRGVGVGVDPLPRTSPRKGPPTCHIPTLPRPMPSPRWTHLPCIYPYVVLPPGNLGPYGTLTRPRNRYLSTIKLETTLDSRRGPRGVCGYESGKK